MAGKIMDNLYLKDCVKEKRHLEVASCVTITDERFALTKYTKHINYRLIINISKDC